MKKMNFGYLNDDFLRPLFRLADVRRAQICSEFRF